MSADKFNNKVIETVLKNYKSFEVLKQQLNK